MESISWSSIDSVFASGAIDLGGGLYVFQTILELPSSNLLKIDGTVYFWFLIPPGDYKVVEHVITTVTDKPLLKNPLRLSDLEDSFLQKKLPCNETQIWDFYISEVKEFPIKLITTSHRLRPNRRRPPTPPHCRFIPSGEFLPEKSLIGDGWMSRFVLPRNSSMKEECEREATVERERCWSDLESD
ncbi:hypothetical protein LINPERPRIM_LOCUS25538 [Linum perenne]